MPGRPKPILVILGTAALVVLLDQLSKRWIERNVPLYESLVPFPALEGSSPSPI